LRARFVAYKMGAIDYLIATTHRDNPERKGLDDKAYAKALTRTARANTFLSLAVEGHEPGPSDDEAFVSFTVTSRPNAPGHQGKPADVQRERSHFKRENGAWLYYDFTL
jgi:uncharacterized protein YchJ